MIERMEVMKGGGVQQTGIGPSDKLKEKRRATGRKKIYHIISKAPAIPDAIRQPIKAFMARVVVAEM